MKRLSLSKSEARAIVEEFERLQKQIDWLIHHGQEMQDRYFRWEIRYRAIEKENSKLKARKLTQRSSRGRSGKVEN
jgi:cell fate (sporulation/competence/biofilm development) regulator YlbF (YheA/YmcA/DUF963 family)